MFLESFAMFLQSLFNVFKADFIAQIPDNLPLEWVEMIGNGDPETCDKTWDLQGFL